MLEDKPALLRALEASGIESVDIREILRAAAAWSRRLSCESETATTLKALVVRIQVGRVGLNVVLRIPIEVGTDSEISATALSVSRFVPMKIKRRGVEVRLILDSPKNDLPPMVNPALLKAIARARGWFEEVTSGSAASLAAIARRDGLPKRYVTRLARLAFVAPAVVNAVVEGRAPAGLTLQMLLDARATLPSDWYEQEQAFERT
jgi:hypothetical protein